MDKLLKNTNVSSKKKILDKLDELICLRESKTNALKQLNIVIKEGIKTVKGLPERWYVRNPNENVINYLEKKYKRNIVNFEIISIGYGELHNEFAFVPEDVDYSWEITQDEFDYALSLLK